MTHSADPHAPLLQSLRERLSTGQLYTNDSERAFYSADLFTRGERCAAFHRHQRDACAERDDARPQEWAQRFTERGERDE